MENTNTAQPEITEAVPAEIEPKSKRAKKETKTPRVVSAAKAKKKAASKLLTDEQKRLAKNAAIRAWRAKNKDRYAAYMKSWREKKKKQNAKPKKRASRKGGSRE